MNLSHDERRRQAHWRRKAATAVATIQWAFDSDTITWGDGVLHQLPQNDLPVIDKLGPLEFMRGEGFVAGLDVLDAGDYRGAVVVIRPSLLPEAQARRLHAQVITTQKVEDRARGIHLPLALALSSSYSTGVNDETD